MMILRAEGNGRRRILELAKSGEGGCYGGEKQLLSFRGWREGDERNLSHVATEQPRATSSWPRATIAMYATEGTKALLE